MVAAAERPRSKALLGVCREVERPVSCNTTRRRGKSCVLRSAIGVFAKACISRRCGLGGTIEMQSINVDSEWKVA